MAVGVCGTTTRRSRDILPGNPVQQGKWASIDAGHALVKMADGRVLDFVAADGSWRLWNYNATQKDILPGNPVQQGKWASIGGGQHALIPMAGGKVLDFVAEDGSWRLWN
jgi:hypothetical protein